MIAAHLSPGRVWQALAQAAQALLAAANAMLGKASSSPIPLNGCDAPILTEVINEFLLAKARAGRSDRYLRQLRVTLKQFSLGRARRPLGGITHQRD